MQTDDQKCDVFVIVKKMVKTNQGIIGEQCIRNDDGVLAVTYEDKKMAWKSYHEKLFNTGFVWDRNILSQVNTVSSVPHFIDNGMIRESNSQMRNRKLVAVLEIMKTTGEAGVDMTTDLVNQIVVEGVVPAEWELSTIVNCYKGEGDSLERGN